MELEQNWTETSYAAGIPDIGDQVIQTLGAVEIIDEIEPQTSEKDF
jgi:hypothetical protein